MNALLQDLRFAVRLLLKNRMTTFVAILALALGIGVNVSSFISVNAMILHPMPFPRLERIMTIWERLPKLRSEQISVAPANYQDLREQSRSFEQFGAYRDWEATVSTGSNPEQVRGCRVSASFFSLLGGKAAIGRTLSAVDEQPDLARAVVVSEGFWKSHLAGSPSVAGKTLSLGAGNYTIVGVMPDSFDYPLGTEIWAPLVLTPADWHERSSHTLQLLGLLKPGVTIADARAEGETIAGRIARQYPATNEDRTFAVMPLGRMTDDTTNHFVVTLLGAAGFVLLLACANIGSLQLARATNRQREMAVRTALGASRLQIARQMIVECVVLSCVGGALGVLLADWNNDYMKTHISALAMRLVPGLRTMRVDPYVVAYAALVSLVTGLLSSLPAILQLSRNAKRDDLADALRERSLTGSGSGGRNRLRTALVVAELALALVLLVGAGLMVRTFQQFLTRDQGFDPKNLLTLRVSLPSDDYGAPARSIAFYDRVLESFVSVPGVKAAGLSEDLGTAEAFTIEGRPTPRAGEPLPEIVSASGHYLAAMRIPVLQGRSINDSDRPTSPLVAVVSNSFARHYWPDSSPLGHRIKLSGSAEWLTVVGVSRDVIDDWFSGLASPTVYLPYSQRTPSSARFALRTAGDPLLAAPYARRQIRSAGSSVPVFDLKTMEQDIDDSREGVKAAADAMTTYATVALLLAVTGIYAMVSFFVAVRTRDIGVRMALGASRRDVLLMTMRQSLRLLAFGLAIGVPLAFLLARAMSSALYGVVQLDPLVFAVFIGVLTLAALIASYLPSYRATRIDPITALRNE